MSVETQRKIDCSGQKALIKGYYLALNDQGIEAVVSRWPICFQQGFYRGSLMMQDGFKERFDTEAGNIRQELIRSVVLPKEYIEQNEELRQKLEGYSLAFKLNKWERETVSQFIQLEEE